MEKGERRYYMPYKVGVENNSVTVWVGNYPAVLSEVETSTACHPASAWMSHIPLFTHK
jgi:hypothetical protein